MNTLVKIVLIVSMLCAFYTCRKKSSGTTPNPPPAIPSFSFNSFKLNGSFNGFTYYGVNLSPELKFSFSAPVNRSTVTNSISIRDQNNAAANYTVTYENNDSTVVIKPSSPLNYLTNYVATVAATLRSASGGPLQSPVFVNLNTEYNPSDKFPFISDSALIQLVQQQTFKYFWDFAHPVSGLARERNTSGDVVTSGGSGFGIMAILTGIHRNFITRQQGLTRMQTIVGFLKNTAQKFKGAFPHWLNGTTGVVVPFSTNDNGADLVETSYLMMGLLTARQYFNAGDAAETALRNDINSLFNAVEWNFFRQNGKKVLYWHWSPNNGFIMNIPVQGWNECLITYVMAAASPTYGIPKAVYDSGFARNGAMINGSTYYGYQLPLGPPFGGPLFFAHYSFMGINPNSLVDQYANYQTQTINHTKINYEYCKANPKNYYGYSDQSWGLTASDIPGGYTASSPTNDVGVIAPTAALASFPYTPVESMKALKFFYYKLGDKLWGQYGFYDAFSLHNPWFSNSYLAIDQGPIIVMIENYRSGLLWNLFMSCPEVKTGMLSLGFTSPYL